MPPTPVGYASYAPSVCVSIYSCASTSPGRSDCYLLKMTTTTLLCRLTDAAVVVTLVVADERISFVLSPLTPPTPPLGDVFMSPPTTPEVFNVVVEEEEDWNFLILSPLTNADPADDWTKYVQELLLESSLT